MTVIGVDGEYDRGAVDDQLDISDSFSCGHHGDTFDRKTMQPAMKLTEDSVANRTRYKRARGRKISRYD